MGNFTFALSWFLYALVAASVVGWGILLVQLFAEGCFYIFCKVFGHIDQHLQDRHWKVIHAKKINNYKEAA
jgi:hypothetical protein